MYFRFLKLFAESHWSIYSLHLFSIDYHGVRLADFNFQKILMSFLLL